MSSRLQLDARNLSLGMRHLANAYEVKAGIGVIAGNTVWSMPERLACTTKMSAIYKYTYLYILPLMEDQRHTENLPRAYKVSVWHGSIVFKSNLEHPRHFIT